MHQKTILASAIAVLATLSLDGVAQTRSTANQDRTGDSSQQSRSRMVEEVIVTGSAAGQSKFDTAYAVSTVDDAAIQKFAALNTADLLGRLPGIYAESSGGDAQNVYRVRGIPNEGNFYSFQEDGMPIYPDDGFFFKGDGLIRPDLMTQTFETVRGGPAPVFADNSAAIFNQVTRQGGPEAEGAVRTTLGDTGLYRFDGYWSGPIADRTYIAAGGFFRYHDGYRDNGFRSDEGGQFRINLRHEMDRGEFRAHVKHFSDTNVFYLPIPLSDPRDPSRSLSPYLDVHDGTLNTPELDNVTFRYADQNGNVQEENRDLSDGRKIQFTNIGFEVNWDLTETLRVENRFRYTTGDLDFDALYSTRNPVDPGQYAARVLPVAQTAFAGAESMAYQLARTGEGFDPTQGSGLVAEAQFRAISAPFESFMNETRLSLDFNLAGEHTLTAGYFYSSYETDGMWRAQDYLMEVRGKPRLLDLVALDGAGNVVGSATDAGVIRYGSAFNSGQSDITRAAFFLSDTWSVNDRLTLDAGIRRTSFTGRGFNRGRAVSNLGNASTLADNAALGFSGMTSASSINQKYTSWTLGGNYTLTDELGVYARASKANRGANEFDIIFGNPGSSTETNQYELGLKYDAANFSIFATAFYSQFKPFNARLNTIDPVTSEILVQQFVGEVASPGIELDAYWRVTDNFSLNAAITWNDAELGDFTSPTGARPVTAEGNQPIRQPIWYGNIRPGYTAVLGDGWQTELYAQYIFVGDRYVDLENNTRLPGYESLGAGIIVSRGPWNAQVYADNLTNEVGITEGNPRSDAISGQGSADAIYGRPIFGRNFRLTVTRTF